MDPYKAAKIYYIFIYKEIRLEGIIDNMYIPSNESKMCDKIADLFSKAALEQYDCYEFAKVVMTQTDLIDTDKLIDVDIIFSEIIQKFNIKKKESGIYTDGNMWFAGYLYKCYKVNTGKSSKDIWNLVPIDVIIMDFGFLHTQGWNYCVDYLEENNADLRNSDMREYFQE